MSIGVIQGKTDDGELVQVVFEAYYKAEISESKQLGNAVARRLTGFTSTARYKSSTNIKILTVDNFQRSGEGRWATHEIIGTQNKPLKEFLGPGLEKITFSVFLSANLGIVPENELEKLRNLRDNGVVCNFVLGSKPVTKNNCIVISLSEDHKIKDNKGQTVQATVNISLEEYPKGAMVSG